MIVIDASALSKYMLKEKNWKLVREYLNAEITSIELIVKEVSNAIWKMWAIHERINEDTALELFHALKILIENKVIQLEPQSSYLDKAFEISIKHNITIYDAIYLAQALKHRKFLTSDKKQANISKKLKIETIYIP